MGPAASLSAEQVINTWPEAELERVFREFGEERDARRLARRIAAFRMEAPILSTHDLVKAVGRSAREGRSRIHPATRIFQVSCCLVLQSFCCSTTSAWEHKHWCQSVWYGSACLLDRECCPYPIRAAVGPSDCRQ